MNFIKAFLQYQQERFPFIVLIPVSLSGVVVTSSILGLHNWATIIFATCFTVAFLFHIRVIDEMRDFSHDTVYYPDRPVQKNIISIEKLKILRFISLLLFFGISLLSLQTFILAVILFAYSSLAARDFFCPTKIRKYFYLYNLLNMVQLIGLQIAVYTMFNWHFTFSTIILTHIALVFLLSMLLEVARKIKAPKDETLGKDTYSYHLGFGGSIILIAAILTLILLPAGYILSLKEKTYGVVYPALFCILSLCVAAVHYIKKNSNTEKLLVLVSAVYYLVVNIVLYHFLP